MQDLVFVPNATTGLNVVIQSMQLQRGDIVAMLDIGYGSVKKMLARSCEAAGAQLVTMQVKFPIR